MENQPLSTPSINQPKSKNLKVSILVIVHLMVTLIFAYFVFKYTELKKQVSQNQFSPIVSPTLSLEESSLDNFIKYILPVGWTKQKLNSKSESEDKVLSFISPNFEHSLGLGLLSGAEIRIYRRIKEAGKSVIDTIEESIPEEIRNITLIESFAKENIKGTHVFECWEGCVHSYYFDQGEYIWQVIYYDSVDIPQNETISSKEYVSSAENLISKSQYFKDINLFLSSLEIKE